MTNRFRSGLIGAALVLLMPLAMAAGGPSPSRNQNTMALWVQQFVFDGGPGLVQDGGPSRYIDGGPGFITDAGGYYCDGGQTFLNPFGCYGVAADGGPLTLDGGPYVFDAGPYYYDAGVALPYALLDGGATSAPIWLSHSTSLSFVANVATGTSQDAYGSVALAVTNDGQHWAPLATPTPIALNQDGGVGGSSSVNYTLDMTSMDYLGIEVVFTPTNASSLGTLGGQFYSKGSGQ